MANYTIFNAGRVVQGDARLVLESIRQRSAEDNDEIRAMSIDDYAAAIIEDAPYFLEPNLLQTLCKVRFSNEYERALTYLAQMPTSDVRIISANGQTPIAS